MRKAVLSGALALTLVAYRFFALNLSTAHWIQYNFAYWSVLSVVVWFLVSLRRDLVTHGFDCLSLYKRHASGIVLVLVCGAFLHLHEPHILKVLQDEPTHVATSLLIHKQRVVATPAAAHIFDGQLLLLQTIPAVRMILFPVLLSLLHDTIGYRVENVFILNAIIALAILTLLYVCGCVFSGRKGGCLAVILMVGLPLFSQITNSGSYDLLNLLLLLGLFLATREYVSSKGSKGLDLMISAGVLLALSRYESILYLIVPVCAIIYKWNREGEFTLTSPAMLSPLAIWPCLTANFILLSNDGYMASNLRGKGEGLFGFQYLGNNVRQMVYYLFNFDLDTTNSLLLSVFGSLGLIALWITCLTRFRKEGAIATEIKLFGLFSVFVSAMYFLVLTHFWGMPTQSSATRFIMPLYTVMLLAAAWLVKELSRNKGLGWAPVAIAVIFAFTISNSSNARSSTTTNMSLPLTYKWFLDYAKKHDSGRTLYVAGSSVYMISYGYPSTPTAVFNEKITGASLCLQAKLYDEILIMDVRYRDPISGNYTNGANAALSEKAQYEVVAERNFPSDQVARILRLKPGLKNTSSGDVELPELRETFKADQERATYYFSLLP